MHQFAFFGRCYLLNFKGKRFTRTYFIKTTRVQLFWWLMEKGVQIREYRRWIFVTFLCLIKLKKIMYRSNIFQKILCGDISWQIQSKEDFLGASYLVGKNKAELVYEGHGKKNIHINDRIFRCLVSRNIINLRSVLESVDKCT